MKLLDVRGESTLRKVDIKTGESFTKNRFTKTNISEKE